MKIQLAINGVSQTVNTNPKRTLLEVLREDLDLTGTKFGCGEGHCRACTVLIEGKPVRSCQTEIGEVEGQRVETIEGLAASGVLHPVQEAFVQEGAMQCGYCVPGMILTVVALLKTNPKPTRPQIVAALDDNLCRCCGYLRIIDAVERAARQIRQQP